MPRGARLDAPGIVHHARARGIERGKIFRKDSDREDLLKRLEEVTRGDRAFVYAWALTPNHFHARQVVRARALVAYVAGRFLGWSGRRLSRELGISPGRVSQGMLRGERELRELACKIDRLLQ